MCCNNNNNCNCGLCGTFTGNNWWWIILLIILFSGYCNGSFNNGGCNCGNNGNNGNGGCGGGYGGTYTGGCC